jgi:hypothetical protein
VVRLQMVCTKASGDERRRGSWQRAGLEAEAGDKVMPPGRPASVRVGDRRRAGSPGGPLFQMSATEPPLAPRRRSRSALQLQLVVEKNVAAELPQETEKGISHAPSSISIRWCKPRIRCAWASARPRGGASWR